MRRLFALLAVLALAAPAAACLWDSELPIHEREFRAQYHGPQAPPARPAPTPFTPWAYLVGGAGVGLMVAAVGLLVAPSRKREG